MNVYCTHDNTGEWYERGILDEKAWKYKDFFQVKEQLQKTILITKKLREIQM